MKMEVLVSTMNLDDAEGLKKRMNILGSSVIINQITKEDVSDINIFDGENRVYSYHEKGLSKSRNKAIEKSNADICIIADDDLTYVDDYEDIIEQAYNKYRDADIIAFYVESTNKKAPTTMQSEGKVGFLKSMKIFSFQITFKRESILKRNIKVDENFGAGSGKYTMGEENIFLFDCLRKKAKIYFVPLTIATVTHNESTWFKGFTEQYFISKGACFYRMSKWFSSIFITQFAVRKYKLYKEEMKFTDALKYMFKGRKQVRCRLFMVGDFVNNTGPAVVNKNFRKCLPKNTLYSDAKNKLTRIIELVIKSIFCDAVCFCSFSKLDVMGIKLAKILKKKTFYIMHGYIVLESKINGTTSEEYNKCEEFILNNVDKVFCVSENLKNQMTSEEYKAQFDYIYNGLDWKQITIESKNNTKELQIMSTGGGMPLKNNLIICEAIKKLIDEKNLYIKYIIAGESYGNKEKILEYEFVEYYEHLKYEDCMKKMAESKLYIQNSDYETFGLAVIEALANGCDLLVSSKVGAIGIIDTIKETDIINDTKNIDEISQKIESILHSSNNNRLFSGIDKEKTDIKYRSKELLEKIGKEL